MKTILLSVLAAITATADVPTEPIAKKGALIFSDDFSAPELGKAWRVTCPTFEIFLKSSGLAHPTKREFYFAVSGRDARFDDVRVWAAEPLKP